MSSNNRSWLTAGRAKSVIGVVKVVGPVIAPIVLPFAIKAASALRAGWDQARARRLGIDVDELPKYSGKGGALHARIAGDARGLAELHGRGDEFEQFAETGETTLVELTAIVRAAERMPTARRKAAHRAVAAELDRLEAELLRRLGVK